MNAELQEMLDKFLAFGVASVDAAVIEAVREVYLSVSYEELQQPDVRARVEEQHAAILEWREMQLATIEAMRHGTRSGKLH